MAKILTSGASARAIFKAHVLLRVVAKGEPDFQRSENKGFFSSETKLVTIKELQNESKWQRHIILSHKESEIGLFQVVFSIICTFIYNVVPRNTSQCFRVFNVFSTM